MWFVVDHHDTNKFEIFGIGTEKKTLSTQFRRSENYFLGTLLYLLYIAVRCIRRPELQIFNFRRQ